MMDAFLAEHYGTNKTAAAQTEDLEKQATVELFCKLASEQGIDLKSMPETQVNALFENWVKAASATDPAATATKTAEEEKEEEKKKLEEKAEKEHEEKKAYAEKCAEAEYLGRIMAHAYVNEMKKIAADPAATGTPAAAGTKVAEIPEAFRAHMAGKEEKKPEEKEEKKEEKEKKDKEASATDRLAFVRAQEIVKAAGLDPEVAAQRISAAFTLGLVEESPKTASAPNAQAAVEVRALELLERVGYPIQWTA